MKAYLLVVAVAVLPACGKKNEGAVLEREAAILAAYYNPRLDSLEARVQDIFKKGSTIPGDMPGIEDVGKRLQEARDTLVKLRGIVADDPKSPEKKSALEIQAENAANAGKLDELEKLVHVSKTALENGVTIINANLNSVESWIVQYEENRLAMLPPRAAAKPEQPSPEPAQPEAVNPAQPAPSQPAPKQ